MSVISTKQIVEPTIYQNQEKRLVWRVVVSGNAAFEDDLKSWYYQCAKVGMCAIGGGDDQTSPRTITSTNTSYQSTTEVAFYAEDETIFNIYNSSVLIETQKAWEVGTKYNKVADENRVTITDKDTFRYLMSRRPAILLQELERAWGMESATSNLEMIVVFSDLDVFLIKDPRPVLENKIATLDWVGADAQNDETGPYNGGFLVIRPTNSTIEIVRQWKRRMEEGTPSKNQEILNDVLRDHGSRVILRHGLLNTTLFPVGKILRDDKVTKTKNGKKKKTRIYHQNVTLDPEIVVFHNNFCHTECSKIERAKELGLWRPDGYRIP